MLRFYEHADVIMTEHSVEVSGLSKKYRLFQSPQDRMKEALHPFKKKYHHDFWALKDVSFEIPKGTTVGILGRNGSGKSTLLQMIASILKPTTGTVLVDGSVSALLELGAGFNPEFTGRSNAVFSGLMLGLSEKEMLRKMPEIEKFAQIGEFIDQPVKIYSSGMFVRLAFATAVNVNPDILLIDEAISVGDTKFQQRCFDRIREFQEEGKTIIFVTHDIEMMLNHSDVGLLMHEGRLVEFGDPHIVAHKYRDILFAKPVIPPVSKEGESKQGETVTPENKSVSDVPLEEDMLSQRPYYNEMEMRSGGELTQIVDCVISSCGETFPTQIMSGSTVEFLVKTTRILDGGPVEVGIHLRTISGISVYGVNSVMKSGNSFEAIDSPNGKAFKFSCVIPLNSGDYTLDLGLFRIENGETINLHVRRKVFVIPISTIFKFDGLIDLAPKT